MHLLREDWLSFAGVIARLPAELGPPWRVQRGPLPDAGAGHFSSAGYI